MHPNILRHLGFYGICRRGNHVLAIKKARGPYTGMWDLPGGKPEDGETPEATLDREFQEETGCNLRSASLFKAVTNLADWIYNDVPTTTYHIGIYYEVEIESDNDLRTTGDGHDSLGAVWVEITPETLQLFAPIVQKVLSL